MQRNWDKICEDMQYLPLAPSVELNLNTQTAILWKPMKNLSRHTVLLCELESSLLMRDIQTAEMSKLGWLFGLVKHAIWADSLYILYLPLLSISKISISHYSEEF
jgi:hypothetical protein